jgi:hypothetical protein
MMGSCFWGKEEGQRICLEMSRLDFFLLGTRIGALKLSWVDLLFVESD